MKTRTNYLIILSILIILFSENSKAQDSPSSDLFIGEWEYLPSGDSVTLMKGNLNKENCTIWIFKTTSDFIVGRYVSRDVKRIAVSVPAVDKWYYDSESKILKLEGRGKTVIYKLDSFDSASIKLIKIS